MNPKHRPQRALLRLAALCAALCLSKSSAFAKDSVWNNPAGGDFNTAANWTPSGVPGAADKVIIALDGTYTVTLSAASSISSLTLGAATGTQTLNLAGKSLTVSNTSSSNAHSVLNNSGGALTVSSPFTIGGTLNQNGGTVSVAGAFTLAGTYNLSGGTLTSTSPQTLAAGSVFNWGSGTLSGTGSTTIESGAILNLQAPGGWFLDRRSLVNSGTINWQGNGTLSSVDGTTIDNETGALLDITSSGASNFSGNVVGANLTFNNKTGALLRKRIGTGVLSFDGVELTNDGTLDLQKGTFALANGSVLTNLVGSSLNSGIYLVGATFSLPGDIITNATSLTLNGATSAITNNLSSTDALAGFNTNAATGTLKVQGGRTLNIPAATGTFTNRGTVTIGAASTLNVQGAAADYEQLAGSTVLQGGTLATTATGSLALSSGTLSGAGTVNSLVDNTASVSPGSIAAPPAGRIGMTNYTQHGTLDLDIGRTNALTPAFDQLAVNGTVSLSGSLNLTQFNGFTPAVGDMFKIIDNAGVDAVVGRFNGQAQGTLAITNNMGFAINYAGGDGNDVVLTAVPLININNRTVTEGNASINAVFTVTLSKASAQTVTVEFETAGGTTFPATAGTDYTALPLATLSFAPGQISKTISVPIIGDLIDENNETFFVNLNSPTNAAIGIAQGVGTITDDDAAPNLSINNVTTLEGASGTTSANFTVNLSAASSKTVTVQYATATPGSVPATAGVDYVAVPLTTLTFAPGETTKQVTVLINGDTKDEADERFAVNLSAAVNATIADGEGVGTIADDDAAPNLSINNVTVLEGNPAQGAPGTVNANFVVTLSAPSGKTVTVQYNTATPGSFPATPGTDYVAVPLTTLTFAPGETTKTVTVLVNCDTLDEDSERFTVNLKSAANAAIIDSEGVGTITDDDATPNLSINNVNLPEGNSGTTAFTFTVTLSAASGKMVTVKYQTLTPSSLIATPGVDYTALPLTTLTFAPGQTTKQVTVLVNGDTIVEGTERFAVKLSAQTNAGIADSEGVGTIANDDVAALLFGDTPSE